MGSLMRQLSCGTLGKQRRSDLKALQDDVSPARPAKDKNFWEIDGGYESVLNRLNDGNDICTDLVQIIEDRAQVEEAYVKALRQWEKKWSEYLATKSNEYGTSKEACYEMLRTGSKTADFHYDLHTQLIDKNKSPIAEIRTWLKVNYQKSHIHFKKRNEFDELFKDAQKQWKQYFKQLDKCEKDYHNSVKQSIEAEQNANKAQKNPNKTEEQRRQARQEADLAASNKTTSRKTYEDQLKAMEPFKNDYIHDMSRVFERAQDFEKTRIQFMRTIYEQYYKCFAGHITDQKYKDLFKEFIDKTAKIKPEDDVKWWSNNYGAGVEPKWPKFVEYSE